MSDIQRLALDAFNEGNLVQAKELATKAVEQGLQTEIVYNILSECELSSGNIQAGLPICCDLAKQTRDIRSTKRLAYWIAHLFATGALSGMAGNTAQLRVEASTYDHFLDIILDGVKYSFGDASDSDIEDLLMNLATLGYWSDETPFQSYGSYSKSIIDAFPVPCETILECCLRSAGMVTSLRQVGYVFAAAGYTETAEDLMARISVPLRSTEQLSQLLDGMTHRAEVGSVSGYDIPQIERSSRRLVQLTNNKAELGRVLDIGCGTGMTSQLIRSRSEFIHGIDINTDWLKAASGKKLFDQLDNASILDWSGQNQKYDSIVSCMVSYEISKFEGYISKIGSLLKPNGRAYIDILTASGEDGQRQLDTYVLRTKEYVRQVIENHDMQIVQEQSGPNQFSVGTCIELMKPA